MAVFTHQQERVGMSSSYTEVKPWTLATSDWRHFLSMGCGSGCLPWVPGTWGTLPAVFLFWLVSGLPIWALVAITAAMFFMGALLTIHTAKAMGRKDPGNIVWDEWVGYFVTVLFVPHSWGYLWLGFLFFRLFDWFKVIPVTEAERRTKDGWAIMLDDVVAGILAWGGIIVLREFGGIGLALYFTAWGTWYLDVWKDEHAANA